MKNKKLFCCICGKEIKKEGCPGYFGNNPEGAAWKTPDGEIVEPTFKEDDRCCDECDNRYVIPGRIYRYKQMMKKEEK